MGTNFPPHSVLVISFSGRKELGAMSKMSTPWRHRLVLGPANAGSIGYFLCCCIMGSTLKGESKPVSEF